MKKLNALIERKNKLRKWEKQAADYRAGIIASVIANVNTTKNYKPEDFVPKEKKRKAGKNSLNL